MKFLPKGVTRFVGRSLLKLSKNSPHILFGVGVVGAVGATVLACRATLKLEDILDEWQDDLDTVIKTRHPDYSEDDRAHDTTIVYIRTAGKIVKLYAPAAAVGVVAIAALTGSHHILTKRNMLLTAAYATLDKSFASYRDRVKYELGDEKERAVYLDSLNGYAIVDDPKGEPTIVEGVDSSIYARWFDPACSPWQDDPSYNHMFLRAQQAYANDLLHARGHIFLNEVYDALGLPRTKEGAVVGWVYDKLGISNGDNFVDFGIDFHDVSWVQHIDNREGIWLDFNVDGIIFDRI